MKELLVWYYVIGTNYGTGSLHLEIKNNSIAYTIAEYESRMGAFSRYGSHSITHYMNENNEIINVKTTMVHIPKHI